MIILNYEFDAQYAFLYVQRGSAKATNEMEFSTSSLTLNNSGGAISTANPDFIYNTNGTSYQQAVSPCSSGTVQKITRIEIVNLDTITDTVQFFYANLSPTYLALTAPITLQPNWSLHYEDNKGWYVLDANGAIVTGNAPGLKMCNYQFLYNQATPPSSATVSAIPYYIPLSDKVSDINGLCTVNLSTGEITWNESGTFEIDITIYYNAAGVGSTEAAAAIYNGGGSVLESGGICYESGGYQGLLRLHTVRTVTTGDTWYVAFIGGTAAGYIGFGGTGWYPSTNTVGAIFSATQLA